MTGIRKSALVAGMFAALLAVEPASANHKIVNGLVKVNKVIYYCVGWEAGRMISIKQYGRAGDPGRCPKGFWLPR